MKMVDIRNQHNTDMQIEQKELTNLKREVSILENQARNVIIENREDYESAIDFVSKLKDAGSKIKDKKESVTKPLNEALKNARNLFNPIEDQFASAEKILKGKLLAYKREVDEEARRKEEQYAARVERGTMKADTAEQKIAEVDRIDTTTKGDVGRVQVRKVKKVRIADESSLPREYLTPDMVKIRRDALGGKEIPGVIIEEEEVIAAS